MSAICNLAKKRVELLKLSLVSGMKFESDMYKKLSQEAMNVIIRQIGNVGKLTCDNVTTMLEMFTSDKIFDDEQMTMLREVIHTKLDQNVGMSNASNTKTQKVLKPEAWITGELYEALTAEVKVSRSQLVSARISLLATFFGGGGYLDETRPGNVLRPDMGRAVNSIFWSVRLRPTTVRLAHHSTATVDVVAAVRLLPQDHHTCYNKYR